MKNLITRTLTGIFIVIIVLGGIILHPVSFFLVQLLIMSGSLYEFYRLVGSDRIKPYSYAGIATGVGLYGISAAVASGASGPGLYLLCIPAGLAMMVAELYRKDEFPFDSISYTFAGIIYIALPWSLVPYTSFGSDSIATLMNHNIDGFSPGAVLALFMLLWANDSGAYLVGVSIGRHRLFERISPKKSWEGFFGGMLSTVAVAWAISGWIGLTDLRGWIIIALIVSIGATFGDLVESMLKRSFGVKDSGSIMPGHGGFLDRFDSLLFAWPLMFLFLTFFG